MKPTNRAASLCSVAGFLGAALLTVFFHHNRGTASLPIALFFGSIAAAIAFILVRRITERRFGRHKPTFGPARGAITALVIYFLSVVMHTAVFPGSGGFWTSLFPILMVGTLTFGWAVALCGVVVGLICERLYFRPAQL